MYFVYMLQFFLNFTQLISFKSETQSYNQIELDQPMLKIQIVKGKNCII